MTKMEDKIRVGTLTLANRLVMPPMATGSADEEGRVTPLMTRFYATRAGKIGLMTLEHTFVSIEGKVHRRQVSIARDEDVAGLRMLTVAVHEKGTTKFIMQLNHAGLAAGYEVRGQEDIDRIEDAFAMAALRAKDAGFDGVELHAGHGFLLNQFYSPLANNRTDAYSAASLENRTRFAMEIIQKIRKAVGETYPLSLRFGAVDEQMGGSAIEEAPEAAKLYAAAGIDMISITEGITGYGGKSVRLSDVSRRIKEAVEIPVLLTGGIRTRTQAEGLLNDGSADLIGVGRPMLQNPEGTIREFLG